MTDGERLVWAASFARALDRSGDAISAVRIAARAVVQLRAVALRRAPEGNFTIAGIDEIVEIDERTFLDEIVNVP